MSETTYLISLLLGRNVALVTLYQDCSSNHDSSKDMAARGRDYFPYISKFQKPLDRFQYNLAGMFLWWPSTKFVQAVMIRQKTWPLGGGAYFPYIAIWNILKIFLSESTGPISVWQNCSFGDPLSRFSSSHHDAWKKHGLWRAGL